jgi:protein phosphatase
MGTTIVAALWHDARVSIANVGDSRLYRLRRGTLEALTRDHTLVQDQLDRGVLTLEQARYAANRNVLTRAVGTDLAVAPDVRTLEVLPQDVYLLCSDGLHDMLSDRAIETALGSLEPHAAAEKLVAAANDAGGLDNVSAIVVRVLSTAADGA